MTCELVIKNLTDEQMGQICGILSIGCDRQTAADFVGCSLADIRHAMRRDAAFTASLCRARASIELSHMRNLQESAREKKDWRASAWWLERSSPERFGRRSDGTISTRQLKEFVAILTDMLDEEIHDAADRERLAARFRAIGSSVEQILLDTHGPTGDSSAAIAETKAARYGDSPRDGEELWSDPLDENR